jgi:hypothetical protein
MTARPTEMTEYLLARPARFLQCIRENREPAVVESSFWQMPFFVGGLGETDHLSIIPGEDGGVEGDGAEGVAKDV